MKKEYQAPTLEVYILSARRGFLAGSIKESTNNPRTVDGDYELD